MIEEILKELAALTEARRECDDTTYVTTVLHPIEGMIEERVPGFYVLWSEEYRQYGLFPVNG